MKNTVRILLLGKSGVGKSSFINYFLNRDVAATGVGEPCTQETTKYVLDEWEDCSIELFDSKGLETLDADNWTQNILAELDSKRKLDFSQRYHTIFYCISARKKIEIYDINTLKALHNSAGQQIHIILTHCDGVDEDILQEREQYLRDEISKNLYIYRIVSINKTKRNGAVISKSGREAVLSGVFDLLWNDVAENVSETISNIFYSEMSAEINRFKNKLNAFIDKNLNVFSLGKMLINEESDKMDAELDALIDNYSNIFDEFQNRLEQESVSYIEPLVKLYNSYSKIAEYKELVNAEEIIDACFEIVANSIEPFNDMDIEELVMNNFEIAKSVNNIDDVDDGSVKEIIKAIFSAGKGVLSIKNDAKRLVLKAETYLYDTIKREDLRDTIYKAIVNR